MIFSPETELFLEIQIFSPPNLFHWKLICVAKVNMLTQSFFLFMYGFSLSNTDRNCKIPIFFSSSIHFCRKFWLNYSFYCCHFMFDYTQTWIFSNFLHLYDCSHSHFSNLQWICNDFFTWNWFFLGNLIFFHHKTCFIGIIFVNPTAICSHNHFFYLSMVFPCKRR